MLVVAPSAVGEVHGHAANPRWWRWYSCLSVREATREAGAAVLI